MKRCQVCKDSRRPALWRVRQTLHCNACYERLLEYNPNIDIEQIERLSDSMSDFEQVNRGRKPKSGVYPATTAAV